MKDGFLSEVSHDLRSPLTSIRSFTEILLNYPDTDSETQREFLAITRAESQRL
jgi:signal transduction histidine kinase